MEIVKLPVGEISANTQLEIDSTNTIAVKMGTKNLANMGADL